MLSELEREQFFTTSTDAGLTYHYHQVLQTHLEVLLVDELGGAGGAGALFPQRRPAGAGRPTGRRHPRPRPGRGLGIGGPAAANPTPRRSAGDEALWGMLSLPGAPTDDPGLVLAGARRLARHGQIAEAVAAFRQAEALLDDPEFRRRCTVERSTAAIWLPQAPIPPMPAGHETDANSTMLRLSLELRAGLPSGPRSLLLGPAAGPRPGPAAGRRPRGGLASSSAAPTRASRPAAAAWEPLAERLAARLIDLLIEPDEVVAGQVEEIMLSADVQGWPWLSRVARGLQAAMLLAAAPAPWRISAAAELLDDLERRRRPLDGLSDVAGDRRGVRADRPARSRHAYPPADRGRRRRPGRPGARGVGERAAHRRGRPPRRIGGRTGGGGRAARGRPGSV